MKLDIPAKFVYRSENAEQLSLDKVFQETTLIEGVPFLSVLLVRYYGAAIQIDYDDKGGYKAHAPGPEQDREFLNSAIKLQILITQSIRVGEIVHSKLRNFMEYVVDSKREGFLNETYAYKGEIPISKIDFMGLRNELKAYLKVNKFAQGLEELNNSEKRNSVTFLLHRFITLRNLFTHGNLMYILPEGVYVIEGKDADSGKIEPFLIDIETITAFSEVARHLYDVLSKLSLLYGVNV